MESLLQTANNIKSSLFSIMDTLHSHPEPSFQEHETSALIKKEAGALGLDIVKLGMETGFVGVLRGSAPGKTVAIRADIDAICETEASDAPHPSQTPGLMHACGHDLHTTCALGAMRLLSGRRMDLAGNVVFIFQPGEEVTTGAAEMMAHGLFEKLPDKVDALFGLHSFPLPTGTVGLVRGPMFAGKCNFSVTLTGVSGHCGMPQNCTDAIVAGAALINGVQTIVSRNADPLKELVCSVVSVKAGDLGFFITDTMQLTGTIRALDAATLAMAKARLQELVENTARAYRCQSSLEFLTDIPPVVNTGPIADVAERAAVMVAGRENAVSAAPTLGSDDFALYAKHAPSFYYWLGTGLAGRENPGLHHPAFRVNYDAIPIGTALLAQSALLALEEGSGL